MSRKKHSIWKIPAGLVAALFLLGSGLLPGGLEHETGRLELRRVSPPMVKVQASPGEAAADATSASSEYAVTEGENEETDATSASSEAAGSPESVSSASLDEGPKDAAWCLKCHGPFEKLAARTVDYVTEWDEKANPHTFVPHDTETIVECAECHQPHAIPFDRNAPKEEPNVSWCYSCHHAETLAHCNTCHNE